MESFEIFDASRRPALSRPLHGMQVIPTTGKWVLSYGEEAMYISEKRTPIPPIDSWRLANGRPEKPRVRFGVDCLCTPIPTEHFQAVLLDL